MGGSYPRRCRSARVSAQRSMNAAGLVIFCERRRFGTCHFIIENSYALSQLSFQSLSSFVQKYGHSLHLIPHFPQPVGRRLGLPVLGAMRVTWRSVAGAGAHAGGGHQPGRAAVLPCLEPVRQLHHRRSLRPATHHTASRPVPWRQPAVPFAPRRVCVTDGERTCAQARAKPAEIPLRSRRAKGRRRRAGRPPRTSRSSATPRSSTSTRRTPDWGRARSSTSFGARGSRSRCTRPAA